MKTDHHWNAQGIERGLTLISGELDSKVMKDMDCSVEVDGPPCNGSLARNGLMLLNEAPIGFNCVNGDITLLADGSAQSAGEHKGYFSSSEDAEVFNFYENYYENFSEVRGIGEGSALLVSDSYGNALKAALGLQFRTISCEYLLHYRSNSQTASLGESISQRSRMWFCLLGRSTTSQAFASVFRITLRRNR